MTHLIWHAIVDESGQDLIEYALLTAFLGVVGLVAWQNVGLGVAAKYVGWDTGIQDLSKCTPDPGGAGC